VITEHLLLTLSNSADVLAWVEAMTPEDRATVSPQWLARAKATTSPDPWVHGFVITLREGNTTIGSCAYKGPPDPEGMVEIAYGIHPEHQGRGYATEAARALTQFALERGARIVRAHTLPQENASTHVLRKCGFTFLGEVMDPEDGRIWRWELSSPIR
jgi:ribosomal-protein-alanine N-acetyltransferase